VTKRRNVVCRGEERFAVEEELVLFIQQQVI
jgi:hypothetical protein